jgi:potassium-transporting ATPase KdpC subunit
MSQGATSVAPSPRMNLESARQPESSKGHSVWSTSIRYTILVTILFGIVYPLVVTGVAKVLFPRQANGSLILKDGKVIGSELLAQSFTSDRYFHPRPSATAYSDAADFKSDSTTSPSGGSNLAQSNKVLLTRIQGDIDKLQKENPGKPVPIDMVTQSGSGLDPDITPDAAYYQAPRVAKVRSLTETQVRDLIAQHITPRQLGILGEPRVNVLELNLALDAIQK